MAEQSFAAAVRAEAGAVPRVVRHRSPLQWVTVLVVLLLTAELLRSALTNPRFLWGEYVRYLFDAQIVRGLYLTLLLTAIAMAVAIVLGTVLAVMRLSDNPLVSAFSVGYAWLFRGTPELVQLIFFYNFAALYPEIGLVLPWGFRLSVETNRLITPFLAAILGLGLNQAAYMSEIVRGGILSVPRVQWEAGAALGMTRLMTFLRVILPQALVAILPPTFNVIIGMLKLSSLVSVLSLSELLYTAEQIYSLNFEPIPLLLVVSTWYLLCTSVLMGLLALIERRIARRYGLATGARQPVVGHGEGR